MHWGMQVGDYCSGVYMRGERSFWRERESRDAWRSVEADVCQDILRIGVWVMFWWKIRDSIFVDSFGKELFFFIRAVVGKSKIELGVLRTFL